MLTSDNSMKLRTFVDVDKMSNKDLFPGDVFALLGDPLKVWLDAFLDKLGVADSPKILSKVSSKCEIEGRVYIEDSCSIEPYSYIKGPAYIGKGTEVRHGAYIRGYCYIGRDCVIGHSTEVKESIFFDKAKAGHFAYVGNSLLGSNVNLGAGTKLANLKLKKNLVYYKDPFSGERISSGLKKFGAIMGDSVATGCNSVLSPGSLLFPGSSILPCEHFNGTRKN